jgi:hypothetical protein
VSTLLMIILATMIVDEMWAAFRGLSNALLSYDIGPLALYKTVSVSGFRLSSPDKLTDG